MNIPLRICSVIAAFLCIPFFSAGQAVLSKGKPVEFSRTDRLCLPTYSWTRTLVSYPVEFIPALGSDDDICLIDENSGEAVPFQISDRICENGKTVSGKVNFFTELPSGGSFSYRLHYSCFHCISLQTAGTAVQFSKCTICRLRQRQSLP